MLVTLLANQIGKWIQKQTMVGHVIVKVQSTKPSIYNNCYQKGLQTRGKVATGEEILGPLPSFKRWPETGLDWIGQSRTTGNMWFQRGKEASGTAEESLITHLQLPS